MATETNDSQAVVPVRARERQRSRWQTGPLSYLIATAIVLFTTLLIALSHADATLVNIPPLYVLAVQAVAVIFGSRQAVLASIAAFLAFDWFFVDPKYQFTVRDPFEFVALCVFLATAILVGQLTALFRGRADEAYRRELAATALAKASWTVASEADQTTAISKVLQDLMSATAMESALLLSVSDQDTYEPVAEYSKSPGGGRPQVAPDAMKLVITTGQRIGWNDAVRDKGIPVAQGTNSDLYLPVATEGNLHAILFLRCSRSSDLSATDRQVVNSLLNHIAVVLQRTKLLQAQAKSEALAETNKLKTALLQMVSHDFRSPLASIKASVSSMLSEEGGPIDPHEQRGLLQAIEGETDRLNRMVGNLLDLSRLEANAWQARLEPCSVSEMVGPALDTFNAHDNKRIHVSLPKEPMEATIDPVQIVQVLKNILENALKYSNGDVELTAHQEDGYLTIEVLDRGPGIPAGDELVIFEPFFRAKEHQEVSLPGVGMGLAVCRGLVEANGGEVTAHNRTGGGAVFCIKLPCEKRNPS